jgi:hypothetical protein
MRKPTDARFTSTPLCRLFGGRRKGRPGTSAGSSVVIRRRPEAETVDEGFWGTPRNDFRLPLTGSYVVDVS